MNYPNWFQFSAFHNFKAQLGHLAGKPNLRFLQLGVYTGDASEWLLENIVTGENSILIDVDVWGITNEALYKEFDWQEIKDIYSKRVAFSDKVESLQMQTQDYLAGCNESIQDISDLFDFIYIDGDHEAKSVQADAEGSWPLLKSGGILAFDDYVWGDWLNDAELTPKPAIDRFLAKYKGEYDLLVKNYQVWIRKC
jgi:predicted O-methyltransferase YrrM